MIECVTKAILILVTQNIDQGWLLIRILTKADQNIPWQITCVMLLVSHVTRYVNNSPRLK